MSYLNADQEESLREGHRQPRRGSAVKAPTPCEKEGHNYQLVHFDFPWARVFCSRCGKAASLKW